MTDKQAAFLTDWIEQIFGKSADLKGCVFLKEAVLTALDVPNLSVMQIYQKVAETHHCSSVSVEHTIRYAIASVSKQEAFRQNFPTAVRKYSNSEVIFYLRELVKMEV